MFSTSHILFVTLEWRRTIRASVTVIFHAQLLGAACDFAEKEYLKYASCIFAQPVLYCEQISIKSMHGQYLLLSYCRLFTISCLCGSTVGSVWRHTLMSWHLSIQQCLCTRQQTGMKGRWVPFYLGAESLLGGAAFSLKKKKMSLSKTLRKGEVFHWLSFPNRRKTLFNLLLN